MSTKRFEVRKGLSQVKLCTEEALKKRLSKRGEVVFLKRAAEDFDNIFI
jgi:hypothetical protein